ncbi:hypothetical protein CJJ19_10030 [Candidatus Williamhamiltonella defendens]|nr:hypothetical protein CJJ19_10030 [Candidatus Hamiltonella defensa]
MRFKKILLEKPVKERAVYQICDMIGVSKPTLYKYIEVARSRLTKGVFSFGPSETGGEKPQPINQRPIQIG